MTIFDELKARGLLAQLTDEEEIKELVLTLLRTVCMWDILWHCA